jgi:DNA-binding transcriptional LysR family regulator
MLDDEPLVLLPDTFFQTRTIKRWFSRAGVTPSVALETEQISTALGMIERGCLSGFMFERLVKRNPALASIPLSPRVRVDISVIRKKGVYVSREMERLEQFLSESALFDK